MGITKLKFTAKQRIDNSKLIHKTILYNHNYQIITIDLTNY